MKNDRKEVLLQAIELTCNDRQSTYGTPEQNLGCLGELVSVYKKYSDGSHGSAHDAAMFNVLAKIARIAAGPVLHSDNYVDGAAYFAIAFEVAAIKTQEPLVQHSTLNEYDPAIDNSRHYCCGMPSHGPHDSNCEAVRYGIIFKTPQSKW